MDRRDFFTVMAGAAATMGAAISEVNAACLPKDISREDFERFLREASPSSAAASGAGNRSRLTCSH